MPTRDWSEIRHFDRDEFKNDPDRIAWDVVLLLDEMRDAAQVPILIHVGFDSSGHVEDSSHYAKHTEYATAVDFHFVGWSLLKQWIHTEKFGWYSVGLYPFWSSPGLHVDLRRIGRDHPQMGRRWWRDQSGVYQPLTATFIRQLATEATDI